MINYQLKDKLLITISFFFLIYYYNLFFPVFLELETWKLWVATFFIIIFIFFNTNECWQERFLNSIIVLGSLFILFSNNLFLLYLGLELQTFPLLILISKNRFWLKSSEAGLKYFVLGSISSGMFLLGCSLIFLINGSLSINNINNINFFNDNEIIGCIILLILPLFFKVGLAPLHFWIPDIYEGSDWGTISFLSTIPKISVIFIIFQLGFFSDLLIFCSTLSIILGVFGALNQTKLKRLIAYSGISQIGFLSLLFYSLDNLYLELSVIYIFIYFISLISILFILIRFNLSNNSFIIELQNKEINELENIIMILLIFSLAGIPPLAGFINKWLLFVSLLNNNLFFIGIICLILSFIGVVYYLRLIKIFAFNRNIYINSWKRILSINKNNNLHFYFISFSIYFSIMLMVYPSSLFFLFNYYFNF